VIVDALLIDSFDIIPTDPNISAKSDGNVAYNVLYKPWVVVRLHRNVTLVYTLQEWIDRCRRRSFRDFHEFLNPDNRGSSFCVRGAANLNAYVTPLIVRTVVTDRLTARAKAGDRNVDPEQEVVNVTGSLTDKPAVVVHEGRRVTYRRSAPQEIGEPHFNARTLCV